MPCWVPPPHPVTSISTWTHASYALIRMKLTSRRTLWRFHRCPQSTIPVHATILSKRFSTLHRPNETPASPSPRIRWSVHALHSSLTPTSIERQILENRTPPSVEEEETTTIPSIKTDCELVPRDNALPRYRTDLKICAHLLGRHLRQWRVVLFPTCYINTWHRMLQPIKKALWATPNCELWAICFILVFLLDDWICSGDREIGLRNIAFAEEQMQTPLLVLQNDINLKFKAVRKNKATLSCPCCIQVLTCAVQSFLISAATAKTYLLFFKAKYTCNSKCALFLQHRGRTHTAHAGQFKWWTPVRLRSVIIITVRFGYLLQCTGQHKKAVVNFKDKLKNVPTVKKLTELGTNKTKLKCTLKNSIHC